MYEIGNPCKIDFSDVKHFLQIHDVIKESLDFPDYYGANLDALWDCLTDLVDDEEIHIEIIGLNIIESLFDDYAERLIEVFKRFKHCYNDEYCNNIIIEIVDGDKRVALA